MAMKMNDFILEYYKRLIFRSMPIEQFVHFCDFVKSGETAGHMKEWSDNLRPGGPERRFRQSGQFESLRYLRGEFD